MCAAFALNEIRKKRVNANSMQYCQTDTHIACTHSIHLAHITSQTDRQKIRIHSQIIISCPHCAAALWIVVQGNLPTPSAVVDSSGAVFGVCESVCIFYTFVFIMRRSDEARGFPFFSESPRRFASYDFLSLFRTHFVSIIQIFLLFFMIRSTTYDTHAHIHSCTRNATRNSATQKKNRPNRGEPMACVCVRVCVYRNIYTHENNNNSSGDGDEHATYSRISSILYLYVCMKCTKYTKSECHNTYVV